MIFSHPDVLFHGWSCCSCEIIPMNRNCWRLYCIDFINFILHLAESPSTRISYFLSDYVLSCERMLSAPSCRNIHIVDSLHLFELTVIEEMRISISVSCSSSMIQKHWGLARLLLQTCLVALVTSMVNQKFMLLKVLRRVYLHPAYCSSIFFVPLMSFPSTN